jgi:hypothetical protein
MKAQRIGVIGGGSVRPIGKNRLTLDHILSQV